MCSGVLKKKKKKVTARKKRKRGGNRRTPRRVRMRKGRTPKRVRKRTVTRGVPVHLLPVQMTFGRGQRKEFGTKGFYPTFMLWILIRLDVGLHCGSFLLRVT